MAAGRYPASLRTLGLLGLTCAAVACGRAEGDETGSREAPRVVVDSVVPWDVALARFREGLAEPTALADGAESREALVRAFVEALERQDTLALNRLVISRAEFAYLYYATVPEAHPPYDLSPALLWFMLHEASQKGMRRAFSDLGGVSLGYVGHTCDNQPSIQGENLVWGPCVIRHLHGVGDTVTARLFGPILQRGGRFKFISYGNDL